MSRAACASIRWLPALFGVPASDLVDLRVPIADVVPGFRSLRRLAADANLPDPLVRAAATARDMKALARDSGYSERHLRRRVVVATGHRPKRLFRIARMQAVLGTDRRQDPLPRGNHHRPFVRAVAARPAERVMT